MAEEGRIKLPERSTRGKRMRAQLEEEDNEADQEFWNQEFFAEDAGDADYQSEKEEEDVPDSDFFESESEPDEDEEVVAREPKKKTLRPPGAPPGGSRPRPPKPPAPKPKQTPAASASPSAAAAAAGPAGSDELPQSVIFEATYEAPSLRKSTRARVEEAAKEREQREQQAKATRRPTRPTEYRVLTQEELLAEAARTELDNLASLKQLLAQEEETKKKAHAKKQRFGGPLVRFRSRTIQLLLPPEVAAREKEWQEQSQPQQTQQTQQAQQQTQQQAQEPAPQQDPAAAADASAAVKEAPAAAGATPAAAEAGGTAAAAAAAGSGADAAAPAAAEAAPGAAMDAAAAAAAGAADAEGAAKGGADEPTPMQVDPQPPQQAEQQQQQQQQQQVQEPQKPPEQAPAEEQPSGPVLVRQSLDSLQCLGMKAPKWLLPQRAPPPVNKPICPITGGTAHYRDPLTGHWYSDADAFRELRRRLGQPLPPLQPYRRAAASPAAELSALTRSAAAATAAAAAAAGGAEGAAPAAEGPAAAAAAVAEATPAVAGGQQQDAGGLPPGQLQLQEYVEAYMQRQLAVAGAKGRKGQSYEQQAVPDEVAALVLQVSQAVHG